MSQFRIVVSHGVNLGQFMEYNELSKDPFYILEEILRTGKNEADICIFLGDLFSSSNPSSATLASAISIFNQNIVGSRVRNYVSKEGEFLNFGNKNMNIALPVFNIHGTQDSPSEDSVISPLEILNQSNLTNYLGKINESSQGLTICPVTFEKGSTKIALYFIGNMSESLLTSMLGTNKITFQYPGDNFMRILVINQKRKSKGEWSGAFPTSDVHLDQIPDLFYSIIWADDRFKKTEIEKKDGGLSICKVGACSLGGLRQKDFQQKSFGVITVEGTRVRMETRRVECARPIIFHKLSSEVILLDTGYKQQFRSEEKIEKEVLRLLGAYYQADNLEGDGIPKDKPIVRIQVENSSGKYLKVKEMEESLENLVANPG